MSLPEKENLIAQTNLRLSAFYDKLPSFLRLTQSSAKNPLPPHIYLFQYVSSGPALHLLY